ncbi:helix-turn-helix transcriptional regulator [Paenibacillus faecis]|uniref:Helix-turn-helix transcriptional regulator n=1 Tax=Paenibacillus faecis TaxID=862114 RepID=A0A5D0CLP1_9BACL|nr:helix-turn-helix transcriptional regulator [Paenibacillus faecis]TYA10953.1 helix-turn-helix transcriptional regulator [Paenibacillus faecis]
MSLDKKIVGAVIKQKRKEKKLKQNQLSEEVGLSRNYISDIENGRYLPSVDALYKLASCLEIDLNTLPMSEIQDVKV